MTKKMPVGELIQLQKQIKEIHDTTHVIDVNSDCVLVTKEGMSELIKSFSLYEVDYGEPFITLEIKGVKFQCLNRL